MTRLALPDRLAESDLASYMAVGLVVGTAGLVGMAVAIRGPMLPAAFVVLFILGYIALTAPRMLVLVGLPLVLLVPPFLTVSAAGMPDLSPLRLLMLAAFLGVLASWIVSQAQPQAMPSAIRWLLFLVVIFTGYVLLLSLMIGGIAVINRAIAYSLQAFIPAALVIAVARHGRDVRLVLRIIVAVVAIAAMVAIAEYLSGSYLFPADGTYFFHAPLRDGELRAQGIFPHPIVLGVATAACLPLVIAEVMSTRDWQRTYNYAILGVLSTALLLTFSRGPWLAAPLGVVVMATLLDTSRRGRLIFGTITVLIMVSLSPLGDQVSGLIGDLTNPSENAGGYTVEYRQKLASQTWEYASSHPFGVGPGRSETLSLHTSVGGNGTNLARSIDNAYAKFSLEIGPVGLFLFLAIAITVLVLTLVGGRRTPPGWQRTALAALVATQIEILFVSATVATFTWTQLSLLFALLAGASLKLYLLSPSSSQSSGRRLVGP